MSAVFWVSLALLVVAAIFSVVMLVEGWVGRIESAICETSRQERALLEHIRDAIDLAAEDEEKP